MYFTMDDMTKCKFSLRIYVIFYVTCAQLSHHGSTGESINQFYHFTPQMKNGYIASYNFPFTVNSEYSQYTSTITYEGDQTYENYTFCFTFHRYNLGSYGQDPECIKSALLFQSTPSALFCSNGTDITTGISSIWNRDWCVTHPEPKLDITFFALDQTISDRHGYYATYHVEPVGSGSFDEYHINQQEAPCEWPETGPQQACFDRSCIDSTQFCDDVVDCEDGTDESYAHAQCWPQADLVPPDIVACDMEQKYTSENTPCEFLEVGPHWKYEMFSPDDDWGPQTDHTFYGTNPKGKYIVTDFITGGSTIDDQILAFNPGTLTQGTTYCLSFWYDMHGKDTGQLQVFWAHSRSSNRPDWSRRGSWNNMDVLFERKQWQPGQIEYMIQGDIQDQIINFVARRGGDRRSQIALDDISFLEGKCVNLDDISCNFEYGMCGWTSEGFVDTNKDEQNIPELPDTDHSSGNEGGKYLWLNSQTGTLQSAYFNPTTINWCMFFYFYLIGDAPVITFQFGDIKEEIPILDAYEKKWTLQAYKLTEIESSKERAYPVIFEVQKKESTELFLIDHITFFQTGHDICSLYDHESCGVNEYKCDFGSETCIPSYKRCDGRCDCETPISDPCSDEDEDYCTGAGNICAAEGMFQCGNGLCVVGDAKCDGKVDCLDESDEWLCSAGGGVHNIADWRLVSLLIVSIIGSLMSVSYQHT